MPANEQTWRSPKLMHVVFGIASIVMLITTIWMMADDHNRPWKEYQRTFRNLDVQTTEWRAIEQQSAEYSKLLIEKEAAVGKAQQRFTKDDRDQVKALLREFKLDEEAFAGLANSIQRNFPSLYDQEAANRLAGAANDLAQENDKEKKDTEAVLKGRAALLKALDEKPFLKSLRFREDNLTAEVKDKKAYFSQAQSQFDQAVARNESAERLDKLQKAADDARKQVETSTALMQKTIDERKSLEKIQKNITKDEDDAKKALGEQQAKVDQFEKAAKDRATNVGKSILEMPILDAFNSPLKIENRWLPQLPWYNNFKDVARFDRCETCHQGIERTAPGSATAPAFPPVTALRVELPTPPRPKATAKAEELATDEAAYQKQLAKDYGLEFADTGLFSAKDVTISAVYPHTPAAVAGLMGGDVIKAIDGAPMTQRSKAIEYLLAQEHWGKPGGAGANLALSIERGVPQPFATHPRLDLFVGSLSPHPVAKFGCTICHQGQGSATAFKWASHTPNNLVDAEMWTRKHQWFNNENWIYPMYPDRFIESTCLKCHHDVVELERSNLTGADQRDYPNPPAPKVVAGYETIRRYGCFGCHEINGYDGKKRIGPDMRLEPNYSAAAAQLLVDPGLAKLNKQAVKWADDVEFNPNDETARHSLLELVQLDAKAAKPTLDPDSLRMEAVLRDVDNPGSERKVGPSLRHVASKLGFEFMTSWIENPQSFRPDTRMPRFFGQWDHLDGRGLAEAQRLEPIEVRAITNYLFKFSQPFKYTEPAGGGGSSGDSSKKEQADKIARGKKSFQTRGCLACHQHADFKTRDLAQWQSLLDKVPAELRDEDFPELKATQGPDLSRIGAKLALSPNGEGRKWLYSWIRNPSQYHPRTFMPVLFLLEETDAAGKPTGIDPADDVTEYLMTSQQDWKPSNALPKQMSEADEKALDELAMAHLSGKFSAERSKDYLELGIPKSKEDEIQGEEASLINPDRQRDEAFDPKKETAEHKDARLARTLEYVGRRSISKYGCFGCHDIPGYEDSKTIGTSLADWGRKLPARLAFEQINEYLTHTPNGLHSLGVQTAAPAHSSSSAPAAGTHSAASQHETAETEPFSLEDVKDPDIAYFLEKLLGEEREGFLWQKLRAPRSYDFKKTENKITYNDRLRMPKFHFATDEAQNQQKIEQIMTFVLGLVSEPPPAAFVFHPGPNKEAIYAGRKVLEKFNCGGCHILEMERWDLAFKPDEFPKGPSVPPDFPFVLPHFTPQQIADSKKTDRGGTATANVIGMPKVAVQGTPMVEAVTDDENPDKPAVSTATFMNFLPTLINGQERVVGKDVQVPLPAVAHRYPARGGQLARYALPYALKIDDATFATYKEKPNEAWGWLPPPLIGEGKKVQTDWVHDFLLDPFPIRPAAVLRMPKFNMSSAEATKLAAYFAAVDSAEYPYEFDVRSRTDYLERAELEHPRHLEGALGIITDNNFCVKCHKVGDFSPTGSVRAMAPRLDRVHNRLRPEYVHRWIGQPAAILPYTGMPQNFPPPPAQPAPAVVALYKGTSEDQINAVVDLLMNFDRFAQDQLSIKSLVKPAPAAPAASGAAAASSKPAEDAIR